MDEMENDDIFADEQGYNLENDDDGDEIGPDPFCEGPEELSDDWGYSFDDRDADHW